MLVHCYSTEAERLFNTAKLPVHVANKMPPCTRRSRNERREDGNNTQEAAAGGGGGYGDDDNGAAILDLGFENRHVCGDFTILKHLRDDVYRVRTEGGQIIELTVLDIMEMINPNELPGFCYMRPAYKNRRIVMKKKLSLWVQAHVFDLPGFSSSCHQAGAVGGENACNNGHDDIIAPPSSVDAAAVSPERKQKFRSEWEGKEECLPYKKRMLLWDF